MMKKKLILMVGIFITLTLCVTACKKDKITPDNQTSDNTQMQGDGIIQNAVKDYDGNSYDAVRIGEQIWMASNLRTTHYADGTEIEEGSSTHYHHAYRYNPAGDLISYGYLYNWPAVMGENNSSESNPSGVQGICPNGWHVPSDAEWDQLTNYCKSKSEYSCGDYVIHIANALAASHDWNPSETACSPGYDFSSNNATGFGALPAGFYPGVDVTTGRSTYFWGATGCDGCTYAYTHYLSNSGVDMHRLGYEKNMGLSVRCVKD